ELAQEPGDDPHIEGPGDDHAPLAHSVRVEMADGQPVEHGCPSFLPQGGRPAATRRRLRAASSMSSRVSGAFRLASSCCNGNAAEASSYSWAMTASARCRSRAFLQVDDNSGSSRASMRSGKARHARERLDGRDSGPACYPGLEQLSQIIGEQKHPSL